MDNNRIYFLINDKDARELGENMKISKIYEELKDVIFNKKNSEKKKAKLDSEILHKISKVKKDINEAKTEEEVEKLNAKLLVLQRLNKLTSVE